MCCRATLYACLLLAAVDAERLAPECGTSVARGRPTVVNGVLAEIGAFPWHVGVYSKNSKGNYEQSCGGTLVSPDLIISAAHCFHDERFGSVTNATKFTIAAGKYHRLYHWPEYYVQKSAVRSIDVPSNYIGYGGNFAADIALVRVETPFNITELVKPVCMDWDSIYESEHLQKGHIGKAVGWGLTEAKVVSDVLREINLPFIPYDDCWSAVPKDFRGFITPQDKFCAGYLNGSSVCSGDSGGGLCFESGGVWYLRGIVSAIPSQRDTTLPCDYNQYAAFTGVGSWLEWIRAAYNGVGIATNGCILPEQYEGGSYQVSCQEGKCETENEPGSVVPTRSILVHRCQEGYILKGSTASTCQISGWSSLPACIKTCPHLESSSEGIICKYKGKPVPCDSPTEPGTTAYLSCETFYKISGTLNSTDDEITCRDGGKWDRPTLRCIPECGKAPDPSSLINHDGDGNLIQHHRFPWVVNIISKRTSSHEYGGTLIQPDLVLFGFDKQFVDDEGNRRDIDEFTVYAGSYYNFNSTIMDYLYKSKLESMNYVEGHPGIVLLRLVTPFNLTTWVRPVCIDWDDRLTAEQFRKGNIGRVPIDLSIIKKLDERQSAADVAFLPREDCISIIREELRHRYRATELFCAQYSTNSSLIRQSELITFDGLLPGTGIYFESNDVWYLRGFIDVLISSLSHRNSPDILYIVFGNVGHYLEWIRAAYGDAGIDFRGPSGCVLPEQTENGKFELASCEGSCNDETGSRVPAGSIIVHQCDQGYSLIGKRASVCDANGWDSLPHCVKQCPPLVITGMAIVCKHGGKMVPCDAPMPLGALASLACEPFYKTLGTHNSSDEITCLDGGEWDRPTLQCIPECGKPSNPENLLVLGRDGHTEQHIRFPWRILILYSPPETPSLSWIDGTLIQPDLVLSANQGGFFVKDGHQLYLRYIHVFAGLYYDFNETDWQYHRLHESSVESLSFANDSSVSGLVLLRLAEPFKITTWVRPICIDWDDALTAKQLRKGNIGRISLSRTDTNATDQTITEAELAYVPREDCISMVKEEFRNLFTSTDIFCARNSIDSSRFLSFNEDLLKRLGRATGFYFESDGVWYLRGVFHEYIPNSALLSSSPDITYLTFGNVGNNLNWLRAAYGDAWIDSRGPSGCILPEQTKDRRFELASCKGSCSNETGLRVPAGSIIIYRCNLGYSLSGKRASTCGANGWDSLPTCVRCGSAPNPKTLFTYDDDENLYQSSRFPWPVIIGNWKSFGKKDLFLIDGTLIQPDLILTANQRGSFLDDNGHRRDHNNTYAYAGFYYRFNSTNAQYSYRQRSPIKSISFANPYVVDGLVLVRLAQPFRITPFITPICIDWYNKLTAEHLRKGNIGKIPTYLLETEKTDTRKTAADLAYVPREDCVSMIRKEFRHLYAANELFCAHNSTNSSRSLQLDSSTVEQLDPAIGFYFESEGVWYLRGVSYGVIPVSHVLPSSPNITYMRFINVENFLGWIRATNEKDIAVAPI